MADNQPTPSAGPAVAHPDLTQPPVGPSQPEAPAPTAEEPKGFYGGKYDSLEAWEQATRHSEQEGTRLANRVRELEQERLALEAQRANPVEQREQRQSAADQLTEFGVPVEALDNFFQEKFAQAFAPQVAVNRAMQSVMARRPDFARYRNDVDTWLASHPEVNQRYQNTVASNPDNADMALDWVFDRFVEDRRSAAVPANGGPPPTDAGIPVAQAAADRSGNPANNDEQLQRAAKYALDYKDTGPYGRERLKDILNSHPDLPKIG